MRGGESLNDFLDEGGEELCDLFFETAQELLQSLNNDALRLEKEPGDSDSLRSLRRTVHTLKGDSAACGFTELSELAHELEDAFGTESVQGHAALAELVFTVVDVFSGMLKAYRHEGEQPDAQPVRKMIRQLTGNKARHKKTEPRPDLLWTEYERVAVQKAQEDQKVVYLLAANIDRKCAMPMAARQLLMMELAKVGQILAVRPEAGAESAPRSCISWSHPICR